MLNWPLMGLENTMKYQGYKLIVDSSVQPNRVTVMDRAPNSDSALCSVSGEIDPETGEFRTLGCTNNNCSNECELETLEDGSVTTYWCSCSFKTGQ